MVKREVQDIWVRAAIAASVWSASEVVLGFLLHSYRVPFKGQILTGIAIVILSALHKEWGGRGIIIRAALICALLKFLAPTPKIIGPVVAILAEGCLFELVVLIFGRTPLTYLVGGGLAMSWTLIQKVGKLLLYYGQGLVSLFGEILDSLSRWSGFDIAPEVFLSICLLACFFSGSLCGWAGYRLTPGPVDLDASQRGTPRTEKRSDRNRDAVFVPALIIVHLLFLVTALSCSELSAPVCGSMLVYLLACSFHYRQRLGKIRNVRIWIPVFLVMLLSGLFLHKGESFISAAGLYAGFTMGFRAFFITFGVHFLMLELANPRFKSYFNSPRRNNLVTAVASAQNYFDRVEGAVDAKQFLRHPARSLQQLIGLGISLEKRLESGSLPQALILTGDIDSGKTTLLKQVLDGRPVEAQGVAGVIAEGVWEQGEKHGFDAVFLPSRRRRILCRAGLTSALSAGRFGFNGDAFREGTEVLSEEEARLIVIDEVGSLELKGQGWATLVTTLAGRTPLLLVVRQGLVDQVQETFNLTRATVVDAADESASTRLTDFINACG